MSVLTKNIANHWTTISPLLTIRNEREYDQAVKRLNDLLDEIGNDERHPLYGLVDTLGTLIQAYEERHYPMPARSGGDMLRFFMEEHGVTQTDLPEPVVPAISRCGIDSRLAVIGCPATSSPSAKRRAVLLRWKVSLSRISRKATSAISSLGTSMPT